MLPHVEVGFVILTPRYERVDSASARPVVFVNGKEDPKFPVDDVRRAFSDLHEIYRAAGAAERCHLVVVEGGAPLLCGGCLAGDARRVSEGNLSGYELSVQAAAGQ